MTVREKEAYAKIFVFRSPTLRNPGHLRDENRFVLAKGMQQGEKEGLAHRPCEGGSAKGDLHCEGWLWDGTVREAGNHVPEVLLVRTCIGLPVVGSAIRRSVEPRLIKYRR